MLAAPRRAGLSGGVHGERDEEYAARQCSRPRTPELLRGARAIQAPDFVGMEHPAPLKLSWRGLVVAVQPRIRLTRSFDERSHSYLGYSLKLHGDLGGEERDFVVAVGRAAQAKHSFRRGDVMLGLGVRPMDTHLETADLYKVSALEILERGTAEAASGPPWHSLAPPLMVYRQRGHRRLDVRRYAEKCSSCVWGCEMAVEMIVDHWKPDVRKYRLETFCYGPLSCALYKAGPTRKVPGRKGMEWEEEDWVDRDAVSERADDPDS